MLPAQRELTTAPGKPVQPTVQEIMIYPLLQPYRSAYFFPMEPRADQVRDIALMDNYFSPSLYYVPAGMTIRWTNKGRHHHTVTADGLWESGELAPGGSISIRFVRPGTYYYYCRLHPRDMRGTITVF